ncbi:MAG: hypothetical protein CO099_11135 [Bdellovibrio sp. CG_4_9_14_3_um_filter_39_7]|nr:MAG: hypothetical protein CO099_11135 [Bdellovibrio sp. CG_4_9_14_3_um_filter_39_7]
MRKISFVVGKDYQANKIFDLTNMSLNRDNCLKPFFLLKEEFKKKGYDLITSDLLSTDDADLVLYNEMPKPFPSQIVKEKSYLMLFETELIRPDNWLLPQHQKFKKIFTWHDKFVDEKTYFKFNFPNDIQTTPPGKFLRNKLLTSISGNKTSHHPLELYSKRLETIKWLEKFHPESFDYFGMGWNYRFDLWWQKVFRKLRVLKFFPVNRSISYKGIVNEKLTVLRNYKFALCYENGRDIDGYITEKIWDCFFAGTIPIYWGAGNISKYIPENCYIDRTKFKNHEELYQYLILMTDQEIFEYQTRIEDFLKSGRANPFSNEFFASTIVNGMIHE